MKPRRPVPASRVILFLFVGFLIGLGLGVLFMGTSHAIIESKGATHFGQEGGSQQPRRLVVQVQQEPTLEATGDATAGATTAAVPGPDSIHTLCTGNGSPYQNYQLRIAFATYKLIQSMPGGNRHTGFTRILHRTKPDPLMGEIETFRADPLQPKCDDWCEYPVSDRGNAVRQFFNAAAKNPSMIKGAWIYMIESDYVFMKPLPIPDQAGQAQYKAWGYPFDYIQPRSHTAAIRKLWPEGEPEDVQGTGPAPMLMKAADWIKVTPDWEKFTAKIEADEALKQELGWVREMYAFSVALAVNELKTELKPIGQSYFIAQLPIEDALGPAHAYHYTQCTIIKTIDGDKDVWAYDKRFHTSLEESLKVPMIPTPPDFQKGWKTIEGKPITPKLLSSIAQMVAQMNRGIKTLQPITAR
ncbi:hypothetical protein CHLNCDRAFT_144797 [Chlorella variabilis]|uniref:Hydroxyproline O-arabinosyltransferase-like domain-containing protein n=1 Tax=Chlorella variabilis TaxID=554065 RepID=E1ZD11_CHLVA|nr:hypothetical protein CHLNCDRAFT_144797 [Chlorella variabilis]EFN56336.1 hypothetical protein CHLNCDRAFT_144797 [Chlorella variabilis]|eukprot:XP_005848438.1 hypothetical protein CHLNCDRAFT_144797 [Chlorella variabilis]